MADNHFLVDFQSRFKQQPVDKLPLTAGSHAPVGLFCEWFLCGRNTCSMRRLLFNKQQETRRLLADCYWSPECSESNFIWAAFPLWGGQQIKHSSAVWQAKMMLVWNKIENLNNPNDMVGYGHSSWGKPWNDDINLRERGRVTNTHSVSALSCFSTMFIIQSDSLKDLLFQRHLKSH